MLEKYKSIQADLNVLPFCSQFIPMDVIDHPKHGSIIYHPSILPRHRGASAINWSVSANILSVANGDSGSTLWGGDCLCMAKFSCFREFRKVCTLPMTKARNLRPVKKFLSDMS